MTTILRQADAPVEVGALAGAAGRRLVARRAGLTADAGPEQQLEGARRLGLSDEQARVVAGERMPTSEDLLTLGAALARLQTVRSLERRAGPGRRR